MNKTVNKKNRMMMTRMKMIKMMINSKAVVMTMRMKMDRVMTISNNRAQAMMMINNNPNSNNSKRRTKSCLLLKWSVDNNLNSLSSLLYWAKYPTFHALLITSLALCIQERSKECPEGRILIIMPHKISFINPGWKILKCLNPKCNHGLLLWKTMTLKLIWSLKLLSSPLKLSKRILLSKPSHIKYQQKVKNSFLNFTKKTKNSKDGKSTQPIQWTRIWLHLQIQTVFQTQIKVFTTAKTSFKESSIKKVFLMWMKEINK